MSQQHTELRNQFKSEQKKELENQFKKLAEKWPSAFVAREKVAEFSGGILHPRRCANLDCIGEGPYESYRVGRKRCYPVDSLIQWMIDRAEVVE